jgi:TolA-binding protein
MDLQVHYVELRNQINFLKSQDIKLQQMLQAQLNKTDSNVDEVQALKQLEIDLKESQEEKFARVQQKKIEAVVDIRDKGTGKSFKGMNPFAVLEDQDDSEPGPGPGPGPRIPTAKTARAAKKH